MSAAGRRRGGRPARYQAGLALVAVMWMVAALALLASSLIYATRTEIRSLQQLRDATEAAALGDAAIWLAAADLRQGRGEMNRWQRRSYRFAGREVEVTVVPSAGLVNINRAPAPLLADLFIHAGGLEPAQAEQLAERIRARRSRRAPPPVADAAAQLEALQAVRRQSRFDVLEDLLTIEGFGLELFDTIKDLVTVQSPGAEVYPEAAPAPLLAVLAAGDAQVAERFRQGRDAEDPTLDMTGFRHISRTAARDRRYRLQAELVAHSGVVYRREAWVEFARAQGRLPVRLLELRPVRAVDRGAVSG